MPRIISVDVYAECPTCGSVEWNIVKVMGADPDGALIPRLPFMARCAQCGAVTGGLTISDVTALVN